MDMEREHWIAQANVTALKRRLADGEVHANEAELLRQLAEQEALLRSLAEAKKRK